MTEFWLIRHGETDWNRALRFQGQIDVPLNDIGLTQAQRLRHRLHQTLTQPSRDDRTPARVVSSDLLRARQTAEPLAELLGQPCETDVGLREQCFGVFEGLDVAQIKAEHASHWQRWLDFDADHAVPGAESTRDFHARVMDALTRLAERFAGERVVVVTHGGVLDMVWRQAHRLSLHGPRVCDIPNAGMNQVRHTPDELHILHWADTQHLHDMPPQPVYRQTQLKA